MKLVIEKSPDVTSGFINWIIDRLRDEILIRASDEKLRYMEECLNSMLESSTLAPDVHIDLLYAVLQSVDSLEYVEGLGYYHIQINPFVKLSGTDFKLVSIAKFINYGNQDISGCNIFTDSFLEVSENISMYYRMYISNVGVR